MNRLCNIILITLLALCTSFTGAQAQQLAFPGADGYAKHITGGRGGKVYYVTSLKDCSDDNLVPGTLRWALRTGDNTPRTILFAVNGTIYLESKLKTNHDNVSILGQSAPGGGICITGYPVNITNRNYIIRYIRFRAGEVPALESDGNVSFSALGIENAAEILLDHCSVTWSMEECLTMFDNEVTTVQHCIIGEGLYHSYNVKTSGESSGRGFAMQWGGEKSNMHHVLITNCNGRAPRFNGVRGESPWLPGEGKAHAHDMEVDGDFANNVIHNWGGGSTSYYGGELFKYRFANAPADVKPYNRVYMRNNYFRPGPSTQINGRNNRYFINASGDSEDQVGEWYLEGNKFEKSGTFTPSGTYWSDSNIDIVNNDNTYGFASGENYSARALNLGQGYKSHIMAEIPYALSGYAPVSAEQAFAEVTDAVRGAGANLPRYDEVDQRLVDQAAGRVKTYHQGSRATNASSHPGIIDNPYDVKLQNGYDTFTTNAGNTYTYCPTLALKAGEKYAVDSDADGMPDAYEEAKGFNKTDAADGNAIASNGYTNLENYLNGLADFTLKNSDYQTSDTYVEPGGAVRPETVTLTFVNDNANIEGNAPEAMTIKYGEAVTFQNTYSFYREGYTMTGWSDGTMAYLFGKEYQDYFRQDVTLRPAMQQNSKNLTDRTQDVIVTWDFTKSIAPKISAGVSGIYTTLASIDDTEIDVRLAYNGLTLILPAAEGAVATVTYTSGTTQQFAAVGETLEATLQSADVKTVSLLLPFIIDLSGKLFHSPEVGTVTVGMTDYVTIESEQEKTWTASNNVADSKYFKAEKATNYQLVYGNLSTIHSVDWMQTTGQERDAYRNVIDPNGDDAVQYTGDDLTNTVALNGFLVGQTTKTTYKLMMYVKDCALVRTYAAGSSSAGGYMQVIAIPSDGSERCTSNNTHVLKKGSSFSEYFDLELDPDKSYMLEWSSVDGNDMMVGAIKLYDRTMQGEKSGDALVQWNWVGEYKEDALVDPAKAFTSATGQFGAQLTQTLNEIGDGKSAVSMKQKSVATACSAEHMVEFKVTPKSGYAFTPTQVDFTRIFQRQGTGATGQFDVYFKYGDESEEYLRNTKATSTTNSISIKSTTEKFKPNFRSTTKPFYVRFYLYNMPQEYYVNLYDVKIYGTYEATGAAKHTFTTAVSPANSGVITQTPKGTTFVAGAEITLSAVAANGYKFDNWTNASGTVVSTEATITYTMPDADETLTANFIDLSQSGIFTDGPFQAIVSNADELTQALAAAAQSTAERYYIFLKNGTYDFGATALTAVPKNTSLIGESQEGVLVKNCPSATVSDYQNQTPVLFIAPNQDNVYMQDLTICQSRDWADKTSQGQALAIRQRGKRAIYKNVTMQGVQDTYYINKADASAYLEDCTVAGEVDFIYGDGTAYFKNCRLQPVSSSACITAPNTQTGYMGLVFDGCVIEKISDAKDGVAGYRLGRPWGDSPAATYLNTTMQVLPADAGWGKMSGGLVLRFHEYGSKDAAGNPLDLSKRSIDACSPAAGSDAPVLTAEQAAAYTVENVFKKVAADWTPAQHAAQLTAPTPDLTGQTLAWKPVSGALCYAIVQNGKVVDFTTATTYTVTDTAAKYAIRVANQMGGLSAPSADATTGIENVVQDSGMEDAPLYNIAGQRVSRAAKGIVIRSGKKLINR